MRGLFFCFMMNHFIETFALGQSTHPGAGAMGRLCRIMVCIFSAWVNTVTVCGMQLVWICRKMHGVWVLGLLACQNDFCHAVLFARKVGMATLRGVEGASVPG